MSFMFFFSTFRSICLNHYKELTWSKYIDWNVEKKYKRYTYIFVYYLFTDLLQLNIQYIQLIDYNYNPRFVPKFSNRNFGLLLLPQITVNLTNFLVPKQKQQIKLAKLIPERELASRT